MFYHIILIGDSVIKCLRYQSVNYVKNGQMKGSQRYRCKDWGYQFTKNKLLELLDEKGFVVRKYYTDHYHSYTELLPFNQLIQSKSYTFQASLFLCALFRINGDLCELTSLQK